MPGAATNFFTMHFRRHCQSYDMNPPDETHNVTYLGNVLTIMGKGDASYDKPLSVIWKTFNERKQRRDIQMKLSVTRSGLKAEIKTGLTEYWAHRVTYCVAPPEYPRVFCWVYKHEGKRMRPELRCHAVLCKKASEPVQIALQLNLFLRAALEEYKREKLAMEKARKYSLCGLGPKRKMMLQTGTLNFRPPVSRSKSAPRLGSIDEEDEISEKPEDKEEEELDYSDAESSFGYRTTPILGGSIEEDNCSVTSSSSSAALSVRSATRAIPVDKHVEHASVEYSKSCPINSEMSTLERSPPQNRTFRRQLSMSRESRIRRFKNIQQSRHVALARGISAESDLFDSESAESSSEQRKEDADEVPCCSSSSASSDDGFNSCVNTKLASTNFDGGSDSNGASFEFLSEDVDSLSDESGYYPEESLEALKKLTMQDSDLIVVETADDLIRTNRPHLEIGNNLSCSIKSTN